MCPIPKTNPQTITVDEEWIIRVLGEVTGSVYEDNKAGSFLHGGLLVEMFVDDMGFGVWWARKGSEVFGGGTFQQEGMEVFAGNQAIKAEYQRGGLYGKVWDFFREYWPMAAFYGDGQQTLGAQKFWQKRGASLDGGLYRLEPLED